jgi:hypothetical protein
MLGSMKLYRIDLLAHLVLEKARKLSQTPRNFSLKELELYADDDLGNLHSRHQ